MKKSFIQNQKAQKKENGKKGSMKLLGAKNVGA